MKRIDDTLLSAFIDNELSEIEKQEVINAIEHDAETKARLEALRASNEAAKQIFAEVDNLPERDDLAKLISNTELQNEHQDNVTPLFVKSTGKPTTSQSKKPSDIKNWAMAASILVCALFVYQLLPKQPNIPYQHLTQQLNTEVSGTISNFESGRSEIVQSWENSLGQFCREIMWHTPQQSQPLTACFNDGQWRWQELQQSNGYQTASDEHDIKRESLTKAEERRFLRKLQF
ncbi:anti-sigma factor family protein [Bermanella sp. R86510]|uniref:anti-sigma factor family protein n=1 Tax=unclassified Bermanella TaxID=2627862 RepID=UPI0037C57800